MLTMIFFDSVLVLYYLKNLIFFISFNYLTILKIIDDLIRLNKIKQIALATSVT